MESQNDPKPNEPKHPNEPTSTAKKRFRIDKLEERIAPKKGDSKSIYYTSEGGGTGTLPY